MFNDYVQSTAMTSAAADAYFDHRIYGELYQGDASFVSTMRALLDKRVGQGESIVFSTVDVNVARYSYVNFESEGVMDQFHGRWDTNCSLKVFNLYGDKTDEMMAAMKTVYGGRQGWVYLPAITAFFSRSFDVLCFVNEGTKSSQLFVKKLDMRKFHQLQIATLTALPWYFKAHEGDRISETERDLLNALQENSPDHYLSILAQIAEERDFQNEFVKRTLDRIETASFTRRVDSLNESINELHRNIRNLQEGIDGLYREINEKSITLYGLQAKIAQGETDHSIKDYFLACRDRIRLDSVNGDTSISFHVNAYLSYFDSDVAETYIRNLSSAFYNYVPDQVYDSMSAYDNDSYEVLALLYRKLFVDESIRIRMCAGYSMNMCGGFYAQSSYNFGTDRSDRLPNPHIEHYSCLGSYERRINERLRDSDYIGVLENAVSSCMSVNFTDAPVLRAFIRDLFSDENGRIFELEDGTKMNVTEVLEYVKKEKEEKENEQAD